MRGQRRLHIVRVVFDVVVLQYRLQASSLLLPTLLWARDICRQTVFGEQRWLPGRQLARFDDLFDVVANRSPFLLDLDFGFDFAFACGAGYIDDAAVSWCAPKSSSSGVRMRSFYDDVLLVLDVQV